MPDYMYMLESRLSPEQRAALVRVQELATQSAMNVYLTGGAVRDLISGMTIRDLDFTVEGNPSRLVRELEKGGAKVVEEDVEKLRTADLRFLRRRCRRKHLWRRAMRSIVRPGHEEAGDSLVDYQREHRTGGISR